MVASIWWPKCQLILIKCPFCNKYKAIRKDDFDQNKSASLFGAGDDGDPMSTKVKYFHMEFILIFQDPEIIPTTKIPFPKDVRLTSFGVH